MKVKGQRVCQQLAHFNATSMQLCRIEITEERIKRISNIIKEGSLRLMTITY